MRKLAKEAWFATHRDSLDLSIRDVMRNLCSVVEEAKQLIAQDATQYIVTIVQ